MAYFVEYPQLLDVEPKAGRGYIDDVYSKGSATFTLPELAVTYDAEGFTALKPGEEVAIDVPASELARNANVTLIKANLSVRKGDASESQQTSVSVTEGTNAPTTYELGVTPPTLPSGIEVRLEGGDIFWSFAGTLEPSTEDDEPYEIRDFEEDVNSYLDKLGPDEGDIVLRFWVRSATPGKARIVIPDLEFTLIQTETWENPLDETIRADRNIELSYGALERVPLKSIGSSPETISLKDIKLDIGGEFRPERVLGSVTEHSGKDFAAVNADYTVAQRLILDPELGKAVQVVGMTAPLRFEGETEIYVELQPDSNGFPAAEGPLASAIATLETDGSDNGDSWTYIAFDSPASLELDTPYWIVFKGVLGKAYLALQQTSENYLLEVMVNRGGQLWKAVFDTSSALLRLVYLPEIDNQSAAIEIGVEGVEPGQRLEPGEAQTISIIQNAMQISDSGAVIIIKSHAMGTLSIANVVQEYEADESS